MPLSASIIANTAPVHGSSQQRVRWSMYAAFAALAAAVAGFGWSSLRLEQERAVDSQIMKTAGMQRLLSQQIRYTAELIALTAQATPDGADHATPEPSTIGGAAWRAGHAQTLVAATAESAAGAAALDHLIQTQMAPSAAPRRELTPLLVAWSEAGQRLRHSALALQQLLQQQEQQQPAAEGPGTPQLLASAAAVQAEAAASLEAAQQLFATLLRAADQRAASAQAQLRWSGGGLLLLLALLSLLVVEPTVRAVRRHNRRLAEQATELQRLALVAEHTSALVLIIGRHGRVRWVNDSFTQLTGWTLDDARGRPAAELLHSPLADAATVARVQDALANGVGVRDEWLQHTRDGRALWLDVDLRPLRDSAGALAGFVSVGTDVTTRVRQQGKLQALWAVLPAGVVVHDANCMVVEANRAAERLLGRTVAQMQSTAGRIANGGPVREDGSPYPADELPARRTLATGEPLRNVTLGLDVDGSRRWLLFSTEPQRDTLGQISGVVSCITDITERRELQDRLSATARTDALTRLPNRAVVMDRLERAIEHARRHPGYGFAVLFMDFDRFKQVNDTLGHGAGDELLRQIAERLTRTLRPGDAVARVQPPGQQGQGAGRSASELLRGGVESQVAARLGGDEFVVVLEGVNDRDTAGLIAERLLQELAEPYLIGCNPVQSSASIGVVMCAGLAADPTAELSAEDVLRNADTAMYEAKRAGRGRWVMFDDSMHERVVRALELETDLRRALKDKELFVVYQPVVDLTSQLMVGVEALVRWHHPLRGLVNPVEFIGVAEECGLIDEVGALVLREACACFMQWQKSLGAAAPRQLAVNLSRAQLTRAGLVDDVRTVLQDAGMPPVMLQLEVTESLAAQDDRVQATLRDLKSLGVRLALDDFGTGYSSLACLHQLPVDTVKIDRSFVQHAETVEYHRVLIEATIRVARTLDMTTVAEGIETPGQAWLMRELECDRGQGYLFSRPLEAAELAEWARDTLALVQAEGAEMDEMAA